MRTLYYYVVALAYYYYTYMALYVLKRCLTCVYVCMCVCVITYGHECRVCILGARSADWACVVWWINCVTRPLCVLHLCVYIYILNSFLRRTSYMMARSTRLPASKKINVYIILCTYVGIPYTWLPLGNRASRGLLQPSAGMYSCATEPVKNV